MKSHQRKRIDANKHSTEPNPTASTSNEASSLNANSTNITMKSPENPPIASSATRHAFDVNSLDHCETPLCAYEHIRQVLQIISKHLNIEPSNLRIWDPYYCDGSVKRHLASLGYDKVINENVDFYQRIQCNNVPVYDVLLTNPPYSGDHIERLLQFATKQNDKPFCLLMPNWVARKSEYKSLMGDTDHFFLSPVQPYTYTMPTWNLKPDHVDDRTGETTPYLSSWYISFNDGAVEMTKMEHRLDSMAKRQQPSLWVVAKTVKGLKWKIQKATKKKR